MGKPLTAIESKGFVRDFAEKARFKLLTSSLGFRLRSMSNSRRMLPQFLIVGTQKGGTTFLHALLAQHPQVREPLRKEINYFSFGYPRGEDWYRAHFPHRGEGLVTGESTTNYMFHPLAAERMAKLVPEAKLIVCLREPASRAHSHWQMSVTLKNDSVSFREAIEKEDHRLKGEVDRILADPGYEANPFRWFSYRTRGLFLEQIQRLERSFPKENILVIDSADLFKRADETLIQVERFLGLREWKPSAFRPENVAKSNDKPDPETMAQLREFFRPHNEALFDHLGWESRW